MNRCGNGSDPDLVKCTGPGCKYCREKNPVCGSCGQVYVRGSALAGHKCNGAASPRGRGSIQGKRANKQAQKQTAQRDAPFGTLDIQPFHEMSKTFVQSVDQNDSLSRYGFERPESDDEESERTTAAIESKTQPVEPPCPIMNPDSQALIRTTKEVIDVFSKQQDEFMATRAT